MRHPSRTLLTLSASSPLRHSPCRPSQPQSMPRGRSSYTSFCSQLCCWLQAKRQKGKKTNAKGAKGGEFVDICIFWYLTFTIISLWWHRSNGGNEEPKGMIAFSRNPFFADLSKHSQQKPLLSRSRAAKRL